VTEVLDELVDESEFDEIESLELDEESLLDDSDVEELELFDSDEIDSLELDELLLVADVLEELALDELVDVLELETLTLVLDDEADVLDDEVDMLRLATSQHSLSRPRTNAAPLAALSVQRPTKKSPAWACARVTAWLLPVDQ
jgi:hypothetical protein